MLIIFTGNAWYEEIHWKSFEAVIVLLVTKYINILKSYYFICSLLRINYFQLHCYLILVLGERIKTVVGENVSNLKKKQNINYHFCKLYLNELFLCFKIPKLLL